MIQPDFTVTAAAERFMKRMVRYSAQPAGGFRLTVTPGGCSGYASEFSVEEAPLAGDAVVTVNGHLRLFLPAESRLLLQGATVDFADTPTQSGLVFSHPDQSACGCATSSGATAPAEAAVSVSSIKRVARV